MAVFDGRSTMPRWHQKDEITWPWCCKINASFWYVGYTPVTVTVLWNSGKYPLRFAVVLAGYKPSAYVDVM